MNNYKLSISYNAKRTQVQMTSHTYTIKIRQVNVSYNSFGLVTRRFRQKL